MTEITNFNIRVYGIIVNEKDEILVSTEYYAPHTLTKFVGGGLEKGEGLKDGLIREFQEEISCEIIVGDLYYVNDFFQQSFFKKEDQIISVYYLVEPKSWTNFEEKLANPNTNQRFKWHSLKHFNLDILSLPIDKIVVEKLQGN